MSDDTIENVGYVLKGTGGGGYAAFDGEPTIWHATYSKREPTVFKSIEALMQKYGQWVANNGFQGPTTIERVIERTTTATTREYQRLDDK